MYKTMCMCCMENVAKYVVFSLSVCLLYYVSCNNKYVATRASENKLIAEGLF